LFFISQTALESALAPRLRLSGGQGLTNALPYGIVRSWFSSPPVRQWRELYQGSDGTSKLAYINRESGVGATGRCRQPNIIPEPLPEQAPGNSGASLLQA